MKTHADEVRELLLEVATVLEETHRKASEPGVKPFTLAPGDLARLEERCRRYAEDLARQELGTPCEPYVAPIESGKESGRRDTLLARLESVNSAAVRMRCLSAHIFAARPLTDYDRQFLHELGICIGASSR